MNYDFDKLKQVSYLTNNVIKDDIVLFRDDVFGGSFRKPKYLGCGLILGKILRESYGEKKAQHTFSIQVIQAQGELLENFVPGKLILRKGRNLYKECFLIERNLSDDEERQRIKEKNMRSADTKKRIIDAILTRQKH